MTCVAALSLAPTKGSCAPMGAELLGSLARGRDGGACMTTWPVGGAQRSLGLPWTVCLAPAPGQLQTAGRRAAEVGEVP